MAIVDARARTEFVVFDVAGDHTLTDATGEDVVVLDNDLSMFREVWTIRDPDGTALGGIGSRGALTTLARGIPPTGWSILHGHEITEPDGSRAGNIDVECSSRDRYTITVGVTRGTVIVATIVVETIRNNRDLYLSGREPHCGSRRTCR